MGTIKLKYKKSRKVFVPEKEIDLPDNFEIDIPENTIYNKMNQSNERQRINQIA